MSGGQAGANGNGDEGLSIRARGVSFSYPSSRPGETPFRLRIGEWDVARGERVALAGPSGCGKSTVLDLVAGIRSPASGLLVVEGQDLLGLSEDERRRHRIRTLGFVFQDFPLVEHLDALENVMLPYRLDRRLRLDDEVRSRAEQLLGELGLDGKGQRSPDELSQGERQRVAIARALVTRPRMLLADEPTAGLDPERAGAVLDLVEGLCRERELTLLVVSHDPAVLARFERVVPVSSWSEARRA